MKSALLVAGLLIAAAACSSKTTTVYIVQDAGPAAANDGGSSTLLPDGGASCATTSDIDTCATCCRDQQNAASLKYVGYVVACFCQTTSDFCGTACADTFCNKSPQDPVAGSPCATCLDSKNAACAQQVNPQCEGDPACVPVLECLSDADCQDKPQL